MSATLMHPQEWSDLWSENFVSGPDMGTDPGFPQCSSMLDGVDL